MNHGAARAPEGTRFHCGEELLCAALDAMAGADIGTALRTVRRKQRMSLAEVAARSNGEFKASSLGAYERGDRAISVQRLQRLAHVYGVSAEELLQPSSPPPKVIDLVQLEHQEFAGIVLDLSRFRTGADPRSVAVMNFATSVKSMRSEATSSVIVVRKSDAAMLASLLDCDPVHLEQTLKSGAVLATTP